MIESLLFIVGGFVLLTLGAEYTVRGSVAVANKLKIPTIIIGLTLVAFGTSAPEFVVSIKAALDGAAGVSVGNIVGSNIANILLILGVAALLNPLSCQREIFIRDYKFLFLTTLVFILFALSGKFVFWHGVIMLVLLGWFVYFNYRNSKSEDVGAEAISPLADKSWLLVLVITAIGLAGIIYGADLLVAGAVSLARILGVSEEIIGLTIIAVGTSLPELATTVMAGIRKQNGVALGNIVGSNIWNIVFIMGFTSTIVDVEVAKQILFYDLWVMLGATILLFIFMYSGSKLSRKEGGIFLILYILYLISQVMIAQGVYSFN